MDWRLSKKNKKLLVSSVLVCFAKDIRSKLLDCFGLLDLLLVLAALILAS